MLFFPCQCLFGTGFGVIGSQCPITGIFLRGQGSRTSIYTLRHRSAFQRGTWPASGDGIRLIWGTFVGGDWSGHDNQGGSSGAFWPAGNAGVQEGDDYNQIRYSFDVSRVTPVVGGSPPGEPCCSVSYQTEITLQIQVDNKRYRQRREGNLLWRCLILYKYMKII